MSTIVPLERETKVALLEARYCTASNMTANTQWQHSLEFYVNGQKRVVRDVNPRITVLEYLRREEGFTGTKLSCGQGGCGSCTVALTRFDHAAAKFITTSVNACLKPLVSLDGAAITTTEGLGSSHRGLHPVQERIAGCNGSQCGFCTPGMVMTTYTLLKEKEGKPTLQDVETRFDGNICRCTGYRPILTAAHSFAVDAANCPNLDMEDIAKRFKPYDPARDDPQPPEELKSYAPRPLLFEARDSLNTRWYRATTLAQVLEIKKACEGCACRLVVGNTSTGVYGPDDRTQVFIDIKDIPELNTFAEEPSGLRMGAAVTIATLIKLLETHTDRSPNTFPALISHLNKLANHHVRNAGSWAGNLMLARDRGFPSDLATILYGAGAHVDVITTRDGTRKTMDMEHFLHSTDDIIVTSLLLPFGKPNEYLDTYRVALRSVNAHALLNAAFRVAVDTQRTIREATLVFGVVERHAIRAAATETFLIGKPFDGPTLQAAVGLLHGDVVARLHPEMQYYTDGKPEGKEPLRRNLPAAFLYKFFAKMRGGAAAVQLTPRPVSHGRQSYAAAADRVAMPKQGAELQATGEAKYTDDFPPVGRTHYAAFVLTSRAGVRIARVDPSAALAADGVVAWISAKDIRGANDVGFAPGEEELFVTDKSPCAGLPVGIVVARTQREADAAARLVAIEYGEQYEQPVFTIDDAVANGRIFEDSRKVVSSGDIESAFSAAGRRVTTGTVRVGGQMHFYMERMAAFAVPGEGDHMVVHIGNQAPNWTRLKVAAVLGVPGNKVTVESRRAGGGFGGKLSRQVPTAAAAAVAARAIGQPVKLTQNIHTDFKTVAGRHAFVSNYRVGFDDDGCIVAVDIRSYGNAGFSHDFSSVLVLEFTESLDGVYHIPNFRAESVAVRTNLQTRTAVRSFGHSQATYVIETIIEDVARQLGKPPEAIREANMYTPRNAITPFGQFLEGCNVDKLWAALKQSAEYDQRRVAVDAFNAANRWKKRGICHVPIKYGMAQSYAIGTGALVNINNSDGTVVVFHGGCEIGQGMHTKVAQTVALTLGCPLEKVRIGDCNTDVVPNMMFTGGSIGSEAACEAARLACVSLNQRLAPVREELWRTKKEAPDWSALIAAAGGRNVCLSSTANFIPVGRHDDPVHGKPWVHHHSDYYAFGVAISEVEVDLLTGETNIIRSDMLYDNGLSINPVIDIGQAEGAFVMGLGYFLREEVLESLTDGQLNLQGTWEYKPPLASDIPADFRVELLKDSKFPMGVMAQKGVGEPPMLLAYSAAGAIRAAVDAARRERGLPFLNLSAPLTVDTIQTACHPELKDLEL